MSLPSTFDAKYQPRDPREYYHEIVLALWEIAGQLQRLNEQLKDIQIQGIG
jgi:hypothetical protein